MRILTKEMVHDARRQFFDDVLLHISAAPKAIDEALEQVKYYFEPKAEGMIMDVEYGDFYIEINPFFSGRVWPLAYSMWQIGGQLRVAIILQSYSEDATMADPEEFSELWQSSPMTHFFRGSKLFLEWRFDVPDFHENYATREGFALGMRHLHFRTLKAIRVLATKSTSVSLAG